jgi:hypothetical protein
MTLLTTCKGSPYLNLKICILTYQPFHQKFQTFQLLREREKRIRFEVLSDIDNAVARKYKVVYKLTDDVAAVK